MRLNNLQKAVLRDWNQGELDHLAEHKYLDRSIIEQDLLLLYMLDQLSPDNDCHEPEDGLFLLGLARDEIDVAINALIRVKDAIYAHEVESKFSA